MGCEMGEPGLPGMDKVNSPGSPCSSRAAGVAPALVGRPKAQPRGDGIALPRPAAPVIVSPMAVRPTAEGVHRDAAEEGGGAERRAAPTPVSRILRGAHSARAVSALLADAYADAHGTWFLPWTLKASISRLAELDDRMASLPRAWRSGR